MSYRTVLSRLGGVALVAATVAAGGTALAAPAHPTRPASLVPISQVGPGWSIVSYSTLRPPQLHKNFKGKETLYAVSPQGKKYPFFSWATSSDKPGDYLVDWSGDGQRVLIGVFVDGGNKQKFEQVSLATGKVINSFLLPDTASNISYTRPDGENILATANFVGGARRFNPSGVVQKTLATKGFNPIDSPDGTSVILGTKTGIEQVSNVGGVIKQLHPPVPNAFCLPVRWWNATTVVGSCQTNGVMLARLWLFPINGGKVTALTAQPAKNGEDQGDADAWKLTSGVYEQAEAGCGSVYIATATNKPVSVPGLHFPSYHIITGLGSSLLVQGSQGCTAGSSLFWFNPASKKVSWVIHSPKNITGVDIVVPFGRPLS